MTYYVSSGTLNPTHSLTHSLFGPDLELDQMTLTYKFDLDILKRSTCAPKMKLLGEGFQKLEYEQIRQTHKQTQRQMY